MKSTRFSILIFQKGSSDERWSLDEKYPTKKQARKVADTFSKAGFAVSISKHVHRSTTSVGVVYSTLND